jgi:hypothetical protein
LFKYFNVSSDWTATQWPYLVGVTGNIRYGPTNNTSIWPPFCFVEWNTWSINKLFHHKLHCLHVVYRDIKSLTIIYACFFFFKVVFVSLLRFQTSRNFFGK